MICMWFRLCTAQGSKIQGLMLQYGMYACRRAWTLTSGLLGQPPAYHVVTCRLPLCSRDLTRYETGPRGSKRKRSVFGCSNTRDCMDACVAMLVWIMRDWPLARRIIFWVTIFLTLRLQVRRLGLREATERVVRTSNSVPGSEDGEAVKSYCTPLNAYLHFQCIHRLGGLCLHVACLHATRQATAGCERYVLMVSNRRCGVWCCRQSADDWHACGGERCAWQPCRWHTGGRRCAHPPQRPSGCSAEVYKRRCYLCTVCKAWTTRCW